jgi:hypothetical protein
MTPYSRNHRRDISALETFGRQHRTVRRPCHNGGEAETYRNRQSWKFAKSPAARVAKAAWTAKLMLYESEWTDPSQKTAFQVSGCALPKRLLPYSK